MNLSDLIKRRFFAPWPAGRSIGTKENDFRLGAAFVIHLSAVPWRQYVGKTIVLFLVVALVCGKSLRRAPIVLPRSKHLRRFILLSAAHSSTRRDCLKGR